MNKEIKEARELESLARELVIEGRGTVSTVQPKLLQVAFKIRQIIGLDPEHCPMCGSSIVIGWAHYPEDAGCYECWARWEKADPQKTAYHS